MATTSQCLTEEACWSTKIQVDFKLLSNYAQGFEAIFAKKEFDILPDHWHWDHTIELTPGSEP